MQQEIMHHILGESVYPFDLDGTHKKLAKLHKALQYMERHKQSQPFFSTSFQELGQFLRERVKGS